MLPLFERRPAPSGAGVRQKYLFVSGEVEVTICSLCGRRGATETTGRFKDNDVAVLELRHISILEFLLLIVPKHLNQSLSNS